MFNSLCYRDLGMNKIWSVAMERFSIWLVKCILRNFGSQLSQLSESLHSFSLKLTSKTILKALNPYPTLAIVVLLDLPNLNTIGILLEENALLSVQLYVWGFSYIISCITWDTIFIKLRAFPSESWERLNGMLANFSLRVTQMHSNTDDPQL